MGTFRWFVLMGTIVLTLSVLSWGQASTTSVRGTIQTLKALWSRGPR